MAHGYRKAARQTATEGDEIAERLRNTETKLAATRESLARPWAREAEYQSRRAELKTLDEPGTRPSPANADTTEPDAHRADAPDTEPARDGADPDESIPVPAGRAGEASETPTAPQQTRDRGRHPNL